MSKELSLKSLINPTPRQIEFFEAVDKYKYILYGGAKGGGKSYILRWTLIRQLAKWALQGLRGVRVGLFCEDYPSLKDRQITKIEKEFPKELGTLGDSQIEGMSFRIRPQFGGGIIALRNLDDVSKYASSEFAMAAVDELTKNKRDVFDQLRSIIRWPGIEDTKFIAGTNPGEIGHLWVKKLWVDQQFDLLEDPPKEQFAFVKSLPTDNPHNSQTYLEELKRLPERLRKAYWEGNWDIFAGQYFTEWSKDKHTVQPFVIPLTWKRFRAYDHGRENPACCKWYALDYNGRVWVYRELYVKGKNVDEIAHEINRLSEGESYEYSVADPAIFANTGFVDKSGGQTIAESFARYGVMFLPASNRRIDGWAIMHQYLAWKEFEQPKLVYFNTCYDSIRTIPALVHDEIRPEDLDTKGEDHCFGGDTLVDTLNGQIKIKDLVGKEVYVNTLHGFQKCRSVRKTRKAEVFKVLFNNRKEVVVTGDHLFLTKNGWKEVKNIDKGFDVLIQSDICITSYLRLFKNLTGKGITYVGNIFKGEAKDCISWLGNITMVIFLKGFIYTIKTIISQTIVLRILSLNPSLNTYPITQVHQNIKKEVGNILSSTLNQKLLNGINLKRGENGIVNMQKNWQKIGNGLRNYVQYAKESIKYLSNLLIGQNIAISIVKCAPYGAEEVYDLTVPNIEHFTIEGGIVVHNCADVDRYLLMSLHERKAPPILNETQKKLEDLKRNQQFTTQNLNKFYYG